jgi:hypothetical protein
MFGRILVNTADTKVRVNPNLTQAKQTIGELWSELQVAEGLLASAAARADSAE